MYKRHYYNYDYVINLLPKFEYDWHINHYSYNLYDTVETEDRQTKLTVYEVDKNLIELAIRTKIISEKLLTEDLEQYSFLKNYKDILDEFEDKVKDLKREKLINEDIENWEVAQITDSSISFTKYQDSYSCDRENNCIILRQITVSRCLY